MSPEKVDVCVIGLGYIGLPTAVFLADAGLKVVGTDISEERLRKVASGKLPFVEPGLDTMLSEVVGTGALGVSSVPVKAKSFIVAVPTPVTEDKMVDYRYIDSATDSLAEVVERDDLVVLESTSPPGTTERLAQRILSSRADLGASLGEAPIHVAHCPERVLPGDIVNEMRTNSRVIGGVSLVAADRARQLYEAFCSGDVVVTDAITAEMVKLVENSFRDVNIAFANELANMCSQNGVNVWNLIEFANLHPRVNILRPGPGVGGHCIAVDPWFLVSADRDNSRLIKTAREINDDRPRRVIEQVLTAVKENQPQRVAVLGLAFKADIDDLRESPALAIATSLAEHLPDGELLVCEPNVPTCPASLAKYKNISFDSLDECIEKADLVVLLVDHKEFVGLRERLAPSVPVIDTRGLLQ